MERLRYEIVPRFAHGHCEIRLAYPTDTKASGREEDRLRHASFVHRVEPALGILGPLAQGAAQRAIPVVLGINGTLTIAVRGFHVVPQLVVVFGDVTVSVDDLAMCCHKSSLLSA